MNADDATRNIEQAIESLRSAADGLAQAVAPLKKEIKAAGELRGRFDDASRQLAEANANLDVAIKSLEGIEAALIASMETAKDFVHDKAHSVETRKALLALCQQVYSKLAAAGFQFTIPDLGESLSSELHNPKGKAKSALGDSAIADVISWGYKFPSGQGRLAEVLVGDRSLNEESETPSKPATPTPKAGISMVLDDDSSTEAKPKKSTPTSIFEQLAEAAEKNTE